MLVGLLLQNQRTIDDEVLVFDILCQANLADKVALVVFPILAYYTGKYHLNDTMLFLWLMAAMPILGISVIWGINELSVWLERRKKKQKLH